MAFNETEIAEHTSQIEELFWSRRRPPLHLRKEVREGQRFTGHAIDLFFVRPAFNRAHGEIEEPIARVQYVRTRGVWRLFWRRADDKWHCYEPFPEAASLRAALQAIDEDACQCFFG